MSDLALAAESSSALASLANSDVESIQITRKATTMEMLIGTGAVLLIFVTFFGFLFWMVRKDAKQNEAYLANKAKQQEADRVAAIREADAQRAHEAKMLEQSVAKMQTLLLSQPKPTETPAKV